MKEIILSTIDQPEALEKMYREDRLTFEKTFLELYSSIQDNPIANCWFERFKEATTSPVTVNKKELYLIVGLVALAGFLVKIPFMFSISDEVYYERNAAFIVFGCLTIFFGWKQRLSILYSWILALAMMTCLLYINLLSPRYQPDTFYLSCLHLPIILWYFLSIAFSGESVNPLKTSIRFLQYNGDLIVISTILLLAGGILSGITITLFQLIDDKLVAFYLFNIVVIGVPAIPIIGTYLIQQNPLLVSRISPLIARIFSPLVLFMLVVYLGSMAISGKNPYNDRSYLLVFNLLLVGVMCIIVFVIAETEKTHKKQGELLVLFLLSIVTILINVIALSAIVLRINALGFTPNRTSVLGSNLLMLLHLIMVTIQLGKLLNGKKPVAAVSASITNYLPVYVIWAAVVVFLFPMYFGS